MGAFGFRFGFSAEPMASANPQAASSVTVPTLVLPPADWRMPAAATYGSSAISTATMQAAQASASAKSRPGFAVAAGATEWIAWAVAASATPILLSFVGDGSVGTASVATSTDSTNGQNGTWADAGYADHYPSGSDTGGNGGGRRQHILLPAGGARMIRLTIAAGAAARTISPLLHQLPASGPWDAVAVIGASREDQGMGSARMEARIVAAFASRDPLVFNYAKSGALPSDINALLPAFTAAYGPVAPFAYNANYLGNFVTDNRPYTSTQGSTLSALMTTFVTTLKGTFAGVYVGNTSYRAYPEITDLTDQSAGSLAYNQNVVAPVLASLLPDCYDPSLMEARINLYAEVLCNRSFFTSTEVVHWSGSQYNADCDLAADTAWRRIYTGAWGYTAQEEKRVAAAEAALTLPAYNEAVYAVAALVASSAKTAFQNRLAAIYPAVLYTVADAAVTQAETSRTQADKDAAQAAINTASAAGATVTSLQTRLNAVAVAAAGTIIQVGFGSTGSPAVPGWNRIPATSLNNTTTPTANLLDSNGNETGIGISVGASFGSSTTGQSGSQIAAVPDAILGTGMLSSATSYSWSLTGIPDGKVVDFLYLVGSRSGAAATYLDKFTINGVAAVSPLSGSTSIVAGSNVSDYAAISGVVPSSGTITIVNSRPSGGYITFNAMIIRVRDA